jgi:cytochrome P450
MLSELTAAAAARVGSTRRRSKASLPPGPGAPGPLQLFAFLYEPIAFLQAVRQTHGEIVTISLPGMWPLVQVSNPDYVEAIFKGPARELHAGEANQLLEPFLGSHSVLVLDDEPHLEQRRLLLPPFRGERMKAYGEVMRDATLSALETLPSDSVTTTQHLTQQITLDVILQTVFGIDSATDDELVQLLVATLRALDDPKLLVSGFQRDLGPLSPWGRFLRRRARVRELLEAMIRRRREQGTEGRVDVLSLLLQAEHSDGTPMSDAEIRDELMTMLVAGHETTATALSWALYRVALHEDVRRRLLAEIDEAFPDGVVDPDRILELDYLTAVARETLRIHPVVPGVGRVLKKPRTVGGWDLPADTVVGCSIILAHFDPSVWPEPERFDPERFLGKRISPYRYFPFGGGIRRCIGEAFALYEMRVVLATLLAERVPRLVKGQRYATKRRNLTLSPDGGMPLTFPRRSSGVTA